MASLEGAGPLLSPLKNDEKLTNMKQSKKTKIMANNSTISDNVLVILTNENEEITVLETSQNNERNIMIRLVMAISILLSFGLKVVMKDFWKTLKLLASEDGKDFIIKYLEQAIFSEEKVEISSNNENGQIMYYKILQSSAFASITSYMQVLEGTYVDYKTSDDVLVRPSIRNLSENNFNVSIQSVQNLFGKLSEDSSPLQHNAHNDRYPDFDLVSIN